MKNNYTHYGIYDVVSDELILDEDDIPYTGLNRDSLQKEITYQGKTDEWEVRPLAE